jgi:hypothetical protein
MMKVAALAIALSLVGAPLAAQGSGPALRIDQLLKADLELVEPGAACWAVDAQQRQVLISADIALLRIDGKLTRVSEAQGTIGGDILRSEGSKVVVLFQPRAGKDILGEESVGKPMTMTVSANGKSVSLAVTRWCGA